MRTHRAVRGWVLPAALILLFFNTLPAQEAPADPQCAFFGPGREQYVRSALERQAARFHPLTALTEQITRARAFAPKSQARSEPSYETGSIDSFLYTAIQAAGVKPAAKTTDWEFVRRVTLDLTGRIPKPDRVLTFIADSRSDKRSRLIDELLQSSEWVDKWTMFFGDLFKNADNRPSTGVRRYPDGRNAFYRWIRDSLAANKSYDRMATELIATSAGNSFENGPVNWLVGGVVGGGPTQDIYDQQAANIAETFLGISHMNCLLCHNGRGHLNALSLWGSSATRTQAWQFAAFLSRTRTIRQRTDQTNVYYWSVTDDGTRDYTLGTTSGNRPPRTQLPSCASGKPCYVAPVYPFTGQGPQSGEGYRAALAREITADPQFARAAVNYIWAQFFSIGLVDPPNQFDPARLDPDHPPPAPWTLQPSNARLLGALAARFTASGFDLKALIREIVNSDAYQMSSYYDGAWDPAWEKLFARKFVRRLWAEEIHDAIVQSSGVMPEYNISGFSDRGFGKISWAMQFPETARMPGGTMTAFLDSFLRGNRDDTDRRQEGSLLEALNLMNDSFVVGRTRAKGASANQLIAANANTSDVQMANAIFLGILSRYPSSSEMDQAVTLLRSRDRNTAAQNLTWALYNKVDFVFNY